MDCSASDAQDGKAKRDAHIGGADLQPPKYLRATAIPAGAKPDELQCKRRPAKRQPLPFKTQAGKKSMLKIPYSDSQVTREMENVTTSSPGTSENRAKNPVFTLEPQGKSMVPATMRVKVLSNQFNIFQSGEASEITRSERSFSVPNFPCARRALLNLQQKSRYSPRCWNKRKKIVRTFLAASDDHDRLLRRSFG